MLYNIKINDLKERYNECLGAYNKRISRGKM